jgi:hypothetical protein
LRDDVIFYHRTYDDYVLGREKDMRPGSHGQESGTENQAGDALY